MPQIPSLSLVTAELERNVGDKTFDNIVRGETEKQMLKEVAVWPLLRPDIFSGIRKTPKVLLLRSQDEKIKCHVSECIAGEMKASYYFLPAARLINDWSAHGNNIISLLFDEARSQKLSVVYVKDSDLLSAKFTDDELVLAMKLEFKNWMCHVNNLNCVLLILGVSFNSNFVSNASHQVIEFEINPPDQITRKAIIRHHLSNILYQVSDD